MLKAAIVLMLIATVVSLFSGLFFLVKDDSSSNRLVIALSVRVALAAITVDDIRRIWNRAKECGNMTDDLNTLLTQRAAAIKAAS